MAKARLNRIGTNKQKKSRRPKTFETVSSIITPSNGRSVYQRLLSFFYNYNWDDFDSIFRILLKQPEVRKNLNQYCEPDQMFRLDADVNIPVNRILDIYKVQFLDSKDTLQSFEKLSECVETLIINSSYKEAKIKLLEHKEEFGDSIWFISTYFNVLALNNEYEEINKCVESYSEGNNDGLFELILTRLYQKIKGADATSIVEDTTVNMNREFMSGGATGFAALCSLVFLPFPLYDDFETTEALSILQYFPLVDLYYYFSVLVTHLSTGHSLYEIELGTPFVIKIQEVLDEINNVIESERLQAISTIFKTKKNNNNINPYAYQQDSDYVNYCQGKYPEIIDNFESNFEYGLRHIIKLNIYAKSYIYLNRRPSDDVPYFIKNILEHIINIYRLDNCEKSISELLSVVIKHNNMEFSKYVLIALRNVYQRVLSDDQHAKLKVVLTYGSTPISYFSKPAILYNNVEVSSVGEISKLKFEIVNQLTNFKEENYSLIKRNLTAYEDKTPIRKDYIELASEFFMVTNHYRDLVAFSAKELMKNANALFSLPVEEIASFIDKEGFYSKESVIFSYFYNKRKEKNIDYLLNETFEEFILEKNISRPSEYLQNVQEITIEESFIYQEIANISVIDYLGCFDNSGDLSSERLKILEHLRRLNSINTEDYDSEYFHIIDNYITETGVTKMSHSKITVNKAQFIKSNTSAVIGYMKSYRAAQSDASDNVFTDTKSYKERVAYAKGEKNELAVGMFEELTRGFLSNDEYGLDKTLSSEIRHSFFSNQICSSLQESDILAELNLDGKYQTDEYWDNKYNYVSQSILKCVEEVICDFTKKINTLIERAESWMRVGSTSSSTEKVFIFTSLEMNDFINIKAQLRDADFPSQILESSYNILISQLDIKLVEMKKMLNEVFLSEIDELFRELTNNIIEARQGASLNDLLSSIRKSHESIKDDIKTISEWFSLKTSVVEGPLPIDNIFKIAKKCFRGCFSAQNNITLKVSEKSLIEASHVSPLVFTLINCFHNASKYGSKNCEVETKYEISPTGFDLVIKNNITKAHYEELNSEVIVELSDKLQNMNSSELLKVEGNSGLYKSTHKLKESSAKYVVTPYIEKYKFCLRIQHHD